ncbi:hypothetical protein [Thiomicrorhabdus sp.]|uniref:hypothetical protein n=1 Tax=Thiomicrorhabdus sp. TaxID=2039724 RepID=UPI0029C95AF5|nr:hypothetical protein [Thiomicrorhabdus sp.]
MRQDLFAVMAENDRLKRELEENRRLLRDLKVQYAALEEDFLHALDCEHKETCPKAEIRSRVTITDWPSTHKHLREG